VKAVARSPKPQRRIHGGRWDSAASVPGRGWLGNISRVADHGPAPPDAVRNIADVNPVDAHQDEGRSAEAAERRLLRMTTHLQAWFRTIPEFREATAWTVPVTA
jgi:hypothetical protein